MVIHINPDLSVSLLKAHDDNEDWHNLVDYVIKLTYKWLCNDFDYLFLTCKSLYKIYRTQTSKDSNFRFLDPYINLAINSYGSRIESVGTPQRTKLNVSAQVKWLLVGASLASISTNRTWKIMGKINKVTRMRKNSRVFSKFHVDKSIRSRQRSSLRVRPVASAYSRFTLSLPIYYLEYRRKNIKAGWIISHGMITPVEGEVISGLSGLHWHNQSGIDSLNAKDYRLWSFSKKVKSRGEMLSPQTLLCLKLPNYVIHEICDEFKVHLAEFI